MISKNDSIFQLAYKEYTSFDNIDDSRIKSDFKQEIAIQNEYLGREIYELIQNADDQEAERLIIELDIQSRQLSVKNDGEKPFTVDGFRSIMRAHDSSKTFEKLIGNKGLGFRSVLNWAESIIIHSSGVTCEFSQEIADYYWNKIKTAKKFPEQDVLKYERLAKKENRSCPIPILSIPKVSEYSSEEGKVSFAAEIYIKYKENEEIVNSIKTQLESLLTGNVILFLPHLKQIDVIIDGAAKTITKKHITTKNDWVSVISINDEEWLVGNREGFFQSNDIDSQYQISIAYKKGGINKESNYVYCFFPTKEKNPFNCVIHGTFMLDQSRNHILDDINNERNRVLKGFVADTMLDMAVFVSEYFDECNWEPLSIVYAKTHELYMITNAIYKKIGDYRIFPTINGKYISGKNAGFISNRFSDIFLRLRAEGLTFSEFDNMLIPLDKEIVLPLKTKYPESIVFSTEISNLSERLDSISANLPDLQYRVEIIKAIKELVDKGKLTFLESKPHLLIDTHGNVIKGKGYFYSNEKKPKIPSCIDLHYVDDALFHTLLESFSTTNERYLSSILEKVLDVFYCDKNRVVNMIVPNTETDPNTIVERIQCLWDFFKNGDDISVSENTNVTLFNANNETVLSKKLVLFESDYPDGIQKLELSVDSKWLLAPFSAWNMQVDDFGRLQDFWIRLGVCKYIPLEKRSMVNDLDYLTKLEIKDKYWYTSESNHPGNQTLVPIEDYINQFNLSELLCLIIKSPDLTNRIREDQQLYYFYHTSHSMYFKMNYLAFFLQKMREIKKLQGYVINEDVSPMGEKIDYDYLKKKQIKATEIKSLVSYLGAVENPEELSVDELYQIVRIQPLYNKEGTHLPKIYSMVKKALNAKVDKGEVIIAPNDLKLFAKKIGEQRGRYYHQHSVYYWDNDQMPKSFLKDKPKLDIGSRVGEEQVKRYFGITLAKESKVSILQGDSEINEMLTKGLIRLIRDCAIYILAFRNERILVASERRQNKNRLARLQNNIFCYQTCRFVSGRKQEKGELSENEMIVSKGEGDKRIFNICSTLYDIDHAIRDPEFCDAVVEAIAISLNVKSENTDFLNHVCSILKNSQRENEYLVKRFFGDSTEQVLRDYETKQETISSSTISDVLVDLMKFRDSYKRGFQHYLYDVLCEDVDKQKLFRKQCICFSSNEWLNELANQIVAGDTVEEKMRITIFDKFGVSIDDLEMDDRFEAKPLAIYESLFPGITNVRMEDEERSLLFFKGNEDQIALLNEKYCLQEKSADEQENHESVDDYELVSALWKDKAKDKASGPVEKPTNKGKNRLSSSRKMQIGESAEDIVLKLLIKNPLVKYAQKISETSDKAGGTDKKHYDIEYLPEGENQMRYLEVKSMQGFSCVLTQYEYETGKSNPDHYDIAFVRQNKVYILRSPFAGDKYKDRIWPSEYTIDISNLDLYDELIP